MKKIRIKDLEVAVTNSIIATDPFGIPTYVSSSPTIDGMWACVSDTILFKQFNTFIKNGLNYDNINKSIKFGGDLIQNTELNGLANYGLNFKTLTFFNLDALDIQITGTVSLLSLSGPGDRALKVSNSGIISVLPILTLTNLGTSGVATLDPSTQILNIPNYGGGGGISGLTTDYLPKASSATSIIDSQIYDNGTTILIGTTSMHPDFKFFCESSGAINAIGGSSENGFAGYFENSNTSTKAVLYVTRPNDGAVIAEFYSPTGTIKLTQYGSILATGLSGSDDRMVIANSTGLLSTKSLYAYDSTSAGTYSPTILRPSVFNGSVSNWTLPTPNISNDGREIICENMGSGNISILSNLGSEIWITSAVASTIIVPGNNATFVCRNNGGTYYWFKK